MSLKGLRLRQRLRIRDAKRRAHPGHHKPTKADTEARKARIAYRKKRMIDHERERAIELIFED